MRKQNLGLELVDDLSAEGKTHFTFADAKQRLHRSDGATANLLRRMVRDGLVDRVKRGHYVIRQLGVLGTRAAAEDVTLAVAAVFSESGAPYRIAYRTALDEHDLLSHPVRTIYVASTKRMRANDLSGRPVYVVKEGDEMIRVGATLRGQAFCSNLERALLDAAARPDLISGITVLTEALVAASENVDTNRLHDFATQLRWGTALRRIGSIADALKIPNLAGHIEPLQPPSADIELEPGSSLHRVWRDARWRVRWGLSKDELRNSALQ